MVVDAFAAPLLRVELFQGLKATQLTKIGRAAERIVYRAGDTITRAGDDADAAILIVSGAAEWLDGPAGDEIEIGSLIGEMAMFIDHVYGATIIAKSQVRCLKLARTEMQSLLLRDPELAQHLTSKIAHRLTRVADQLRAIDNTISGDVMPMQSEQSALGQGLAN
jgi:CRP-like cAMP-binding protein